MHFKYLPNILNMPFSPLLLLSILLYTAGKRAVKVTFQPSQILSNILSIQLLLYTPPFQLGFSMFST